MQILNISDLKTRLLSSLSLPSGCTEDDILISHFDINFDLSLVLLLCPKKFIHVVIRGQRDYEDATLTCPTSNVCWTLLADYKDLGGTQLPASDLPSSVALPEAATEVDSSTQSPN